MIGFMRVPNCGTFFSALELEIRADAAFVAWLSHESLTRH